MDTRGRFDSCGVMKENSSRLRTAGVQSYLGQPVHARPPSRRWDWSVTGWWLCGLCLCLAFWVLIGLTLSGIDYS
jgi:hypothetical protein